MLAVLCPGQGAQTPGFLRPWIDVPAVAELLEQLSTRAYVDLVELGCDEDADVVDTAVAQPLIVAAGLATARLLGTLPHTCVVVGHSVGELTAAGVADMVTPAAAVDLARVRGRAMAVAAATVPSGMVAVLGGDEADVTSCAARVGCWVANHNAAGQLVVAGPTAALDRFVADPPAGARVRRLPVAGAFHTPLMDNARREVATLMAGVAARPAPRRVVRNADGAVCGDSADFVQSLAAQITSPVRFDRCLETLRSLGVTATIELAPGGVLTNLVRRALPEVQTVVLKTPDDIDAAVALVAAHASAGEQWTEAWRVLVAPAAGTLHVDDTGESSAVVRNRTGVVPVARAADVQVVEWLAHDGDPVREGQPLARLAAVGT